MKTNIPFLENLVQHPTFVAGDATTTFIDDTPELFRFRAKRDRATKILSYLGETIVNGRPEVKGKFDPKRELPDPVTFGIGVAGCAVVVWLGYRIFKRLEPNFADVV